MKKEWKNIEGYEGLYQVSNLGDVKSLPKKWVSANGGKRYHNGKILKPMKCAFGYMRVRIYKDGISCTKRIHCLVASAFINNPNKKREVNHIDGNKENNILSNLEWATRGENMRHAYKSGLIHPPKARRVIDLSTGIIYDTLKSAAESKNMNRMTLRSRLCGDVSNKTTLRYL